MKLGLLVNPIAGMGGAVGLKGTDKQVRKALLLGAIPKANINALKALERMKPSDNLTIYTGPGLLGEDIARKLGFSVQVLPMERKELIDFSVEDTYILSAYFNEAAIDLLLFAGGDGTARAIIGKLNADIPAIGIPAGVKMQSAVFALRASIAGDIADKWIRKKITNSKLAEVIDLDEELYRANQIAATLFGYMRIPDEGESIQNRKAPSAPKDKNNQQSIASLVVDQMTDDSLYIIGPGTTPYEILVHMGLGGTLLGFDLVSNQKIIKKDANENDIIDFVEKHPLMPKKLILTPIGGQGMILGRGNQQISPTVLEMIEKEELIIIATKGKMAALGGKPFYIDTGDEAIDEKFKGFYPVLSSYNETNIYPIK